MLQIIGVNDKGDYIVSITSRIGKTQMQLEEIDMIMAWKRAEQLTNSVLTVREVLRLEIERYIEIINKEVEALRECLEQLFFHEWNRQGKTVKEMLEEIRKIIDSVGDSEEECRVKKEKRVQTSKAYTRGRGKPRGQQGRAIKYKPYELRVYGI